MMIPLGPDKSEAATAMDQATTMNTVSVVSPCDLHPGYVFVANVNGRKIRVTVPEGGVKQGQVFDIAVAAPSGGAPSRTASPPGTSSAAAAAPPPGGQWKDGVFDCFRFGVLHPTVWNALCCPQVLMKQLSNRLSNAECEDAPLAASSQNKGEGAGAGSSSSSSASSAAAGYKRGTTLFLAACVVDFLLIAPILEATSAMAASSGGAQPPQGDGSSHPSTAAATQSVSLGTQCFYVLWTLALTAIAIYSVVQLRAAVRARRGIQTGRCGPCEDACCVACCHPCTLAQLARETADYDEEKAHCCTADGLAGSERLNPCLFL